MTWVAKPASTQGRQPVCSDPAIQTCLSMKVLFGMALRQTTGFVKSLGHRNIWAARAATKKQIPPPNPRRDNDALVGSIEPAAFTGPM